MTHLRRLLVAFAATAGVAAVGLPGPVAGAVGGVATARADVSWLCRPGEQPDPCRESLATTYVAADGTSRVEHPPLPADPPIDCFYVYPTVSQQLGVNADKRKDPEEIAIARYQASRYSQECRVYAPMYRQLTLASIYTGTPAARAAGRKLAYADVKEAFAAYLAHDNGGRGFVLIGHSQGAGMLRQLVRDVVDGDPAVRARLVSAVLLGGNVLVRRGQTSGGDFEHVPACTAPAQLGCVIAWSTFSDPPPSNTRFGKAPATDITGAGLPAGPQYEVLCTNPASLAANAQAPLSTLVRTDAYPGIIGGGLTLTYGGLPPTAATPWVQPQDHYTARCVDSGGAHVLLLSPVGAARHLNPFPTPDWGVHITDGNIALGNLVSTVHAEASAFLAAAAAKHVRAPRLTMGLAFRGRSAAGGSCARGAIIVRVTGPDRPRVRRVLVTVAGRRVLVTVAGRRVGGDTRAPFRVKVPRRRLRAGALLRIGVRATLKDGRTARLSRTVRTCRG
ncbi:DUF3089 domain-containing protein [Paraconexibacter antarcticus]|uniref:DUF3089 domain-containing protein n=1 Tax=Paraconexibacter antarcticus TaxID=2949664 RepID=A0ABY5DPR4_9ACTN|nr:DUF3089 domain-containing protein [Paraconexibacter antarcticus]UTI64023.1 DUF3089 domain-containing protein [Paraconexibacter antarcticus]